MTGSATTRSFPLNARASSLKFVLSNYRELIPRAGDLAFGLAIAVIGLVIPRRRNLWVVGSWFGARFADNGKWFFLELARDSQIRAIFSTRSAEVCSQLRQQGYEAVQSHSMRGIWTALRAGAYIYDAFPEDANFWAIRGAFWVQMWHGVPLKRIERDIPDPQHWVVKTLRNLDAGRARSRLRALLYNPWRLKKEEMACCTSDMLAPIFARAFGLADGQVRVTGYPRNDAIVWPSGEAVGARTLDSDPFQEAAGKRILLYVPTFRDNASGGSASVFEHTWTARQQLELDELLQRLNAVLFVKLHPHVATKWQVVETVNTIRCLPAGLDVYPFLNRVDALLTDYSSIFFDYLLLERPVIFYCYDLEEYQTSRGFYFDYDDVTPGPKARTFSELLTAIEGTVQGTLDFSKELTRVKNLFHKYSDGQSSKRIATEVRNHLGLKAT